MPSTQEHDRELVRRAQAGDASAMKELFRKYSTRVYTLSLRLTGSVADAEDVLQDTFLRAWRKLASFRGDAAVSTWLTRIAINRCRDLYRGGAATTQDAGETREGVSPAPDNTSRMQMHAALGQLPSGYREVLVLHDVLGMGHAEIAQIQGVQPGTSKSQLHKARARMRLLLSDDPTPGLASARSKGSHTSMGKAL